MTTVPLSRLLWSSRGKHWGFRFLLYPSDVKNQDFWLGVHDRTFGTSPEVPFHSQGSVELPDGSSVPYLAARFYDGGQEWRDDSGGLGREIPHELLLLVDAAQKREIAGSNWSQAVMDILRPVYADLYPQPRAELKQGDRLDALAAQEVTIGNRSQVDPQPMPAELSVPTATDRKPVGSQSTTTKPRDTLIAAVFALAFLVGLAATAVMWNSKQRPFSAPPQPSGSR